MLTFIKQLIYVKVVTYKMLFNIDLFKFATTQNKRQKVSPKENVHL